MEFSTETLVKYLRDSVLVQDPSTAEDPIWLQMSDDDLAIVLEVAKHRDFPNQVLSSLANGVVYPLMLVAKKELYYRLAVKTAPNYDIRGDEAGELKRSQRFEHFMSLIKQTEAELQNYMENGYFGEDGIGDLEDGTASRNKVYVREALITSRYYTRRNYGLLKAPSVGVFVDSLDSSRVQLHWSVTGTHAFLRYNVYISENEVIYDEYKHQIDPDATLVFSSTDQRRMSCEIDELTASKRYHVLVEVCECNGIKGYGGVVFETSTPITDTETDTDTDTETDTNTETETEGE